VFATKLPGRGRTKEEEIPMNEKAYGNQDASFRAAGGEAGIRRLVDRFYQEMDELPEAKVIREMHSTDLEMVKDKLARFLCAWLGGPKLFQEKYGPISIPFAHQRFPIGGAERDAWLRCMQAAVDEQPYDPAFKEYFMKQIAVPAERVRNRD
jgi:hemoglobin